MLKTIRFMYWDISDHYFRFHLLNAVLGFIPGKTGLYLREKWIARCFEHAGRELHIYENVRFRGIQKLSVGNGVHIGVDCFIQASGGVELGDNVILGPGVKIWSMNHVYADPDKPVIEQGYAYRSVRIGRDVWIGANAFIMPGADIGDGSVISAHAVVGGKTIPPYSILAGNPARKIGSRKREKTDASEAPASPEGNRESVVVESI